MERGRESARNLLLEVRAYQWNGMDRAAGLAVLASVIAAAIPEAEPARMGFFLVLADYLSSALSGYPPDPEQL